MAGMREAFAATATDLLGDDPRVAIVLADISEPCSGARSRHDPVARVNVGIAEQTMVGVAAGSRWRGSTRSRTPCRRSWPSGRTSS